MPTQLLRPERDSVRRPRCLPLLLLTLLTATLTSSARPSCDPWLASGPPQEEPPKVPEIERFQAWPELDSKTSTVVKQEVAKLRKARTEAMGESAVAALKEVGPGAAPALIDVLGKERDKDARGRALDVLASIVDARATRLLAPVFEDDSLEVRRWALATAADFPDAGLRAAAEAALKRVEAQDEKKRDAREHDEAALCALSSGSIAGLGRARAIALDRWKDSATRLRLALDQVRSDEACESVLPELAEADRNAKIVALRLLAGCGTQLAVRKIGALLDTSDNTLRVEAINSLRGIVDGDPPLLQLSAFEAVDRATKWKARL